MNRLHLVLCFCFGIASTLEAAPVSLAEWTAAYESPTLGAGAPVQDLALSVGNLRLTMTSGDAAPVLAGGEVVGIFFRGSGRLVYDSVDRLERAVALFNLEKATKLSVKTTDDGLTIETPFEQVLLWSTPDLLPELAPGEAGALQPHFEDHREWFTQDWLEPPSLLFAKPQIEEWSESVVRAELVTGDDKLVYLFDPVRRRSETLYSLIKRRVISQSLRPIILSDQPTGYDRRDFQNPELILSNVTYELTASNGKDASISVTETVLPIGRPQKVLRFNQYSTAYYRGYRHYHVKSVRDDSGKQLPYFHKYHELLVELPEAAAAQQPLELHFEIEGDFLIRPGGDSYWQLGLGPWYPMPEFSGRYFTVSSTVRVEEPFIPLAPGKTLSRRQEGDHNVLVTEIDKPVFGTVVLAGKYHFEEETKNGVTVRIATYGGRRASAIKDLMNLTFKIIAFYEPWLGPFPFPEYNVIEINAFGFGQGPPATMYITHEAIDARSDRINKLFSQGINHRIAHEVAHQYWGHVVKAASSEDTWIHESFADYSSAFVVKRLRGNVGFEAMLAGWKSRARRSHDISSIPLANRIMNPSERRLNGTHRRQLVYDKGAYLLASLHEQLGDDMFFSFLRTTQGTYPWRFVTTKNLIALLEHMTERDFDPFFERYYWGTDMPE